MHMQEESEEDDDVNEGFIKGRGPRLNNQNVEPEEESENSEDDEDNMADTEHEQGLIGEDEIEDINTQFEMMNMQL